MEDARSQSPFLPRQVPIDGYSANFFHFSGMSHSGSILALPSGIRPWTVKSIQDLEEASFGQILAEASSFELLFIGTGKEPAHLPERFKILLRQSGLRFEMMPTYAAAATYNVLLAENRMVGAALIAI